MITHKSCDLLSFFELLIFTATQNQIQYVLISVLFLIGRRTTRLVSPLNFQGKEYQVILGLYWDSIGVLRHDSRILRHL